MNVNARKQYFEVLQRRYSQTRSREEKSLILDEYCRNTGQNRKYVIWKMNSPFYSRSRRRKRECMYDSYVKTTLGLVWKIFDYPCGQRLAPLLKAEIERLRKFGELCISDETAEKLKRISPATIDRSLKRRKETLYLSRKKGYPKTRSLFYQKVPIRLTSWDTSEVGYVEIDLVNHCGSSTAGEYVNTLSVLEISSGWWEGGAIMGKGQYPTFKALTEIRKRSPFEWLGIDSDNDSAFINHHLYEYCRAEGLKFTRSRPYRKNDNAYIEQKNYTHVRRPFGYLRYDTEEELILMQELYRNELRLYKNFFQSVMKLRKKERIGGRRKRQYETAKTPFQRLIESEQISAESKKVLEEVYLRLNPAELHRRIDKKTETLLDIYLNKKGKRRPCVRKKRGERELQPLGYIINDSTTSASVR